MLQALGGVLFQYSEQHQDLSRSRIKRDNEDLKRILEFLDSSSVFDKEKTDLRSITTCISAPHYSNVEQPKEIGQQILKSMEGKSVSEFVFNKRS